MVSLHIRELYSWSFGNHSNGSGSINSSSSKNSDSSGSRNNQSIVLGETHNNLQEEPKSERQESNQYEST